MRIGQTSFVTFVSQALSSAAGFVATIYFARVLGDEVLGVYFFLLAVVSWLTLLGTMGVGSAITKRMSEGENVAEYKAGGGLLIFGFAVVISATLLAFQPQVSAVLDLEAVEYVVVLLVVSLAGSYVDAMLQGQHLVHVYAMLRPVRRIVRTVLQIGAVLLGWQLAGLVFGYVVGGVFVVVIGFVFVDRNYRLPSRRHVERLVEYAQYSWMARMEGKTFNQADVLLLGFLVPSGAVGVYGVTWNIAAFLLLFSTAISRAIFPEISKLTEQDEDGMVASIVEDSIAFAGLFTIPGLVGGVLLAEEILAAYGGEFVRGGQVLGLLILSVLFYGYQKQFVNTLGGIDRPDEAFKINLFLIGSNVVLNLVLIYFYGMVGAAVATAASTVMSTIWGIHRLQRHVDVSIPLGEIGRQIAAAVGMGVLLLAAEPLATASVLAQYPLALAGALVAVGAIAYFVLLALVSSAFRTIVRNNLPGAVPL